jgi:L-ascorbate metabolism protein UlaG (beta-lactamase superfamily)
MKITWLGHACFLIETQGKKIITDPYEPNSYGGAVRYSEIDIQPDIVTVSHQHFDHNYIKKFKDAEIIDKEGSFKINNIVIEGILSYHDKEKGAVRGKNIIFVIHSEGLKIAHFGDIGTLEIDYEKLKDIDVVLVPVGGTFTIDAEEANSLLEKLNPKIFVPMHFKTSKLAFEIDTVDKFLIGKDFQEEEILEINPKNISNFKKIVVLKHQK